MNPYFEAVEVMTYDEAEEHFTRLLSEAIGADPALQLDPGAAKEAVAAALCYVAGYYGDDARERVRRFYSWRSPYRR